MGAGCNKNIEEYCLENPQDERCIKLGARTQDSGQQKKEVSGVIEIVVNDDIINVDYNGANLKDIGELTADEATFSTTTANLIVSSTTGEFVNLYVGSGDFQTQTVGSGVRLVGRDLSDGNAIATTLRSSVTLNTSGDKLASFDNNGVEKSFVDRNGTYYTSQAFFSGLAMQNFALYLGTATVDTGIITMIKGAQAGNPQVTMSLSSDANGDFSIITNVGDIILSATDDIFLASDGSIELALNGTELFPQISDGLTLGTPTKMFSDLFLADGGVINFNNGNQTITHSAGLLTTNGGLNVNGKIGIVTTTPAYGLHVADETTTSTIGIGVEGLKAGCLVMQDTDLGGFTYIISLNGVVSATTIPCI